MARLLGPTLNAPEHKEEGATQRTNFSLTGPLGDNSASVCMDLDKTRLTRGILTRAISPRVRNVCHDVTSRARRGNQPRY
ncbi:hypothetical protein ACNKHR_04345 [Shigella flexneri]